MDIKPGRTTKDSKYLISIKEAIKGREHPKHSNIRMQAHHIISADGMKRSGIGKKIEEYGYNINNLQNLSFIPCTLQGACYLGVQPHRGNHDSLIDENNYEDDKEPRTYHEYVSSPVKDMESFIKNHCAGGGKENSEKVIRELNQLSAAILETIQFQPRIAPLTKIASAFGKTGVGCSGVDSVTNHDKNKKCPVNRKHLYSEQNLEQSQAEGQKVEKISYILKTKFLLKPGN